MLPSSLPTPRLRDPDSVPVLRWGIVGPGWIAERFVKSLREKHPPADRRRRFPLA
ncbi:hypothetical protein ACFS3C_25615 [Azotobacter vinelandii]